MKVLNDWGCVGLSVVSMIPGVMSVILFVAGCIYLFKDED
jgi:hypothetical protein